MNLILLSVTPEETRMALMEDGKLTETAAERNTDSCLVGNIYKGRVQNILPGMQAAFVDIGRKRNAFLYVGPPSESGRRGEGEMRLSAGESVMVQVTKDASGKKGPRVSAKISLPGRHVVLLPTADYIGISRRIGEEAERERLRALAREISPKGMGLILRTAAAGKDRKTLLADVSSLLRLWESQRARYGILSAPALLYREGDMAVRAARDLMTEDTRRLVVDDRDTYKRVKELAEIFFPEISDRVEYYRGEKDLFRAFGAEEALEGIFDREVPLPSGGFLVIDHTEALTVIDVNTGKFVGMSNLSDTAYLVNMEAAEEILRQIRLRDIGGIIVVDFIDMEEEKKREELLSFLRKRAASDRKKTNIIDMTPLGLVEITRKKSRQNYESVVFSPCPCCRGSGRAESPETVAIRISRDIRRIEERSHAAFGYEVEVHETVGLALMTSPFWEGVTRSLGVKVKLTVKPGIHPEAYAISERVS